MNQPLPPPPAVIDTEQLRRMLAGLEDPTAEKQVWWEHDAKNIAVEFCAALPSVFGKSLDRMTLWAKICSSIEAAFANVVNGDLDQFVQCVLEGIQAEPAQVLSCDRFTEALSLLHTIRASDRQDWITYLKTHRIPVLVMAKARWQQFLAEVKAQ